MLAKFAGQIVSGAVSALCLALIAAQRVESLDPSFVVTMLLFIQWQVFGLTIAKLGVDQAIFATVSRDTSIQFSNRHFLLTKVLPLSMPVAVVIGVLFSPAIGLIAGASILVDAFSTMVIADLNARQRFGQTAVASLLNYPIFLVLLTVVSALGAGVRSMLLMFLVSSVIRASWLSLCQRYVRHTTRVRFQGAGVLAAQQTLNYVMFRGDQLVLVLVSAMGLRVAPDFPTEAYVYLGKFPELVSTGLVIVGMFLFPRLKIGGAFVSMSSVRLSTLQVLAWGLVTLGVMVGFIVYRSPLWASEILDRTPWHVAIPFLVQTLLVLPVNGITYLMLGEGHIRHLVRIEAASVVAAGAAALIALSKGSLLLLAWTIPLQLGVFIMLSFVMKAGHFRRQRLYAHADGEGVEPGFRLSRDRI